MSENVCCEEAPSRLIHKESSIPAIHSNKRFGRLFGRIIGGRVPRTRTSSFTMSHKVGHVNSLEATQNNRVADVEMNAMPFVNGTSARCSHCDQSNTKKTEKGKSNQPTLEWLAIARILDRFFLIFFFLVTLGLVGMLVGYGFYRMFRIDNTQGDADFATAASEV